LIVRLFSRTSMPYCGDIEFPEWRRVGEPEVLDDLRQIDTASSARAGVRRRVDCAQKFSMQSRDSVAGVASNPSEKASSIPSPFGNGTLRASWRETPSSIDQT
jgi:hypothetical protein